MATREFNLQTLADLDLKPPAPFDPADGHRSTILHLDYTGPLPDAASSGTRYFQVSCWGGYINIQPLQSLRHEHTTLALKKAVEFFRAHDVVIDTIRMDNQQSNPLILMALQLHVKWDLISPYVKNPNRSERAIRTAKNHMISARAGFHPDCPPAYLDKCLFPIEMTLNIVRPFEYDSMSRRTRVCTELHSIFDTIQLPLSESERRSLRGTPPTTAGHGLTTASPLCIWAPHSTTIARSTCGYLPPPRLASPTRCGGLCTMCAPIWPCWGSTHPTPIRQPRIGPTLKPTVKTS
jgi:hypothetical protein